MMNKKTVFLFLSFLGPIFLVWAVFGPDVLVSERWIALAIWLTHTLAALIVLRWGVNASAENILNINLKAVLPAGMLMCLGFAASTLSVVPAPYFNALFVLAIGVVIPILVYLGIALMEQLVEKLG